MDLRRLNDLAAAPTLTPVFFLAKCADILRQALAAKETAGFGIETRIANGETHPVACREAGITEHMFYRWRKEYGGLKADQAKRLKELEQENSKLSRPRAHSGLGTEILVLSKAALH
jgi:putative transposase